MESQHSLHARPLGATSAQNSNQSLGIFISKNTVFDTKMFQSFLHSRTSLVTSRECLDDTALQSVQTDMMASHEKNRKTLRNPVPHARIADFQFIVAILGIETFHSF